MQFLEVNILRCCKYSEMHCWLSSTLNVFSMYLAYAKIHLSPLTVLLSWLVWIVLRVYNFCNVIWRFCGATQYNSSVEVFCNKSEFFWWLNHAQGKKMSKQLGHISSFYTVSADIPAFNSGKVEIYFQNFRLAMLDHWSVIWYETSLCENNINKFNSPFIARIIILIISVIMQKKCCEISSIVKRC